MYRTKSPCDISKIVIGLTFLDCSMGRKCTKICELKGVVNGHTHTPLHPLNTHTHTHPHIMSMGNMGFKVCETNRGEGSDIMLCGSVLSRKISQLCSYFPVYNEYVYGLPHNFLKTFHSGSIG